MKSVCICFVVLLFALAPGKVQAQFALNVSDETGNNYPMPVNYFKAKSFVPGFRFPWHSTDLFQIYERLDSLGCNTWLNTPYTHWNWSNTDLYQIWLKLDSCGIGGGSGPIADSAWTLFGNTGTTYTTNFLGTTDDQPLTFRTFNRSQSYLMQNGAFGLSSGYRATSYNYGFALPIMTTNVCIGDSAGYLIPYGSSVDDTTTSHNSVIIGSRAGLNAKRIYNCVYIGAGAGMADTGNFAGGTPFAGASAYECIAIGYGALKNNHTGENTVIGTLAADANTTGGGHVVVGLNALGANTVGTENTAVGTSSMAANVNGSQNVVMGYTAMRDNTSGSLNTAIGYNVIRNQTSGDSNTMVGAYCGVNQANGTNRNTALGYGSLDFNNGDNNIGLGYFSGTFATGLSFRGWLGNLDIQANAHEDSTQRILYWYNQTDSSTSRLHINGKTHINDGTQATGKIFTCDNSNGGGSWNDYGIDTTANDSATINTYVGQFKVASGSATFTLINSKILGLTTLTFFQSWNPTNSAHLHINSKSSGQVIIGFDPAPAADTKIEFQLRQ